MPIVEIREMVLDDLEVDTKFKKEDVDVALEFYSEIFDKISAEPMMLDLANHFELSVSILILLCWQSDFRTHKKRVSTKAN